MRFVVIEGVITDENATRTSTKLEGLRSESEEPIFLTINSPGGDTKPARSLADMVMNLDIPVHGIVTKEAMSAGFIILQSCTWRIATEDAKFMFHPPGFTAEEASQISSFPVDEDVRFYDDEEYLEWLQYLSHRSGRPFDELESFGREEKEFTALEALELGFIDEIVLTQEPPL